MRSTVTMQCKECFISEFVSKYSMKKKIINKKNQINCS